jgi:hypothetical protein
MTSPYHMTGDARYFVYACFDVEGWPFYIGEGSKNRPENHVKLARTGKGAFYARLREMLGRGDPIRFEKLYSDLDKALAIQVERALLSELGDHRYGGLLTNKIGYGWERPAGRDVIQNDPRRRRKWRIAAVKAERVTRIARGVGWTAQDKRLSSP